jgi:hypothetical protein
MFILQSPLLSGYNLTNHLGWDQSTEYTDNWPPVFRRGRDTIEIANPGDHESGSQRRIATKNGVAGSSVLLFQIHIGGFEKVTGDIGFAGDCVRFEQERWTRMVDLRVSDPLISNLLAVQKTLGTAKKAETAEPAKATPVEDAVRLGIDVKIAALAEASPSLEQAPGAPAITQQEARDMALDVGQNLKAEDAPFAGNSEKVILSLFS